MAGRQNKESTTQQGRSALRLRRNARLGKYRLEKRLGTGGFCEVWRARDCVEGIRVALKIPQTGGDGQRDNEAVLKEIRLVARLRHPHILPVKNADIINGHTVLATELSVGTLADCSKPMAVRRILSIITQVLDGLSYAHRNRVVHCDVTPANIFLFPNGQTALGDFGISFQFKGRATTVDEYGTPGYVAPEQAYGRPTYSSDCFSVGLILYEYLAGVLPRWPFRWPLPGYKRLCKRTTGAVVDFLKRSLAVGPERRFANAAQMLDALLRSVPKDLRNGYAVTLAPRHADWRQMRSEAFIRRYNRVFPAIFRCVECGDPIDERMTVCPWCGSGKNRFDTCSRFDYVCPRCHKGILPEWRFCPWCYGPGFASPSTTRTKGVRYHSRCRYCGGKLMRFMRYCPWCHRKVRRPWQVRPFPEVCARCGWSVDSAFWNYCAWCGQNLTP